MTKQSRSAPATWSQKSAESAPETGPQVIARYVKHLESGPGVYRMMDKAGEVIYVGKARNLKNRVQNYTRLGGHTNRIAAMIASTASMEFVNTGTEAEALLLEANLIKRFKPRYNVSFRDDKSFPYIVIRRDQEAPQISKHRGARIAGRRLFRPLRERGAVNRTINTLQRAFRYAPAPTAFTKLAHGPASVSDQALRRALHARDSSLRTTPSLSRRR